MENLNGFILLHRRFINWEWYYDEKVKSLFIHLLLKANHKEIKWQGKIIKRGELITSINHLSMQLGYSVKQIRLSLEKLKSTKEISTQGTNKYTKIIISNYETYQDKINSNGEQKDEQKTNKGQTKDKQRATNNNDNNENNEKNNIGDAPKNLELHDLQKLILAEYPIIQKIKKQLTLKECLQLEKDFSRVEIKNILDSMENYKKTPQYNTVYLTIRKWINRERERNEKPKREKSIWEQKRELTMSDIINSIETNPDFQ